MLSERIEMKWAVAALVVGLAGCADSARAPSSEGDVSDAGVSDAGPGGHLCPWGSAEVRSGRCIAYPASSCPERRPALGSSCAAPAGDECYYCEPGQSELRVDELVPTFRCSSGAWDVSDQAMACHPDRPAEEDADAG